MRVSTMIRISPGVDPDSGLMDRITDFARQVEAGGFPGIWIGDSLGRGRPTGPADLTGGGLDDRIARPRRPGNSARDKQCRTGQGRLDEEGAAVETKHCRHCVSPPLLPRFTPNRRETAPESALIWEMRAGELGERSSTPRRATRRSDLWAVTSTLWVTP